MTRETEGKEEFQSAKRDEQSEAERFLVSVFAANSMEFLF